MFISRLVGICFLCFLAAVGAAGTGGQRNITIDDHYGDEITHISPTYLPSEIWKLRVGRAKLNASLTHNRTWHDATHKVQDGPTSVNFGFTGVSIYVYCVIANKPFGLPMNAFADYKFFMDGDLVGRYTHDVEQIPDYFYNTSVYVNTTMENIFHNFSIVMDSTEQATLLLFDYAIYTTIEANSLDAPTTTLAPTGYLAPNKPTDNPGGVDNLASSRNAGVTAQLGAALGVLSFFILIGAVILFLPKKSRIYRKVIRSLPGRSGGPGDLVEAKGQTSYNRNGMASALDTLPPYAR